MSGISNATNATMPAAVGPPVRLLDVFEQLAALRSLGENWDGYRAAAPRVDAIEAATRFLESLARSQAGYRLLPTAVASPTRTGGILIEWTFDDRELEVDINSATEITYAYVDRATAATASGRVPTVDNIGEFLNSAKHMSREPVT